MTNLVRRSFYARAELPPPGIVDIEAVTRLAVRPACGFEIAFGMETPAALGPLVFGAKIELGAETPVVASPVHGGDVEIGLATPINVQRYSAILDDWGLSAVWPDSWDDFTRPVGQFEHEVTP